MTAQDSDKSAVESEAIADTVAAALASADEEESVELTAEEQRFAELEQSNAELSDKLRHYAEITDRLRSEFATTKARLQREHENALSAEKAEAAGGFLEVLDSFDKALGSTDSGNGAGEAFIGGMRMIRAELERALTKLGIERFDSSGERFDPERHEAMTTMVVQEPELDGRVVQEVKTGATIGEQVVRPAVVVVGRYVAPETAAKSS
jgi:molecular chaperone GrpE